MAHQLGLRGVLEADDDDEVVGWEQHYLWCTMHKGQRRGALAGWLRQ
jgi:hypothetical protein